MPYLFRFIYSRMPLHLPTGREGIRGDIPIRQRVALVVLTVLIVSGDDLLVYVTIGVE